MTQGLCLCSIYFYSVYPGLFRPACREQVNRIERGRLTPIGLYLPVGRLETLETMMEDRWLSVDEIAAYPRHQAGYGLQVDRRKADARAQDRPTLEVQQGRIVLQSRVPMDVPERLFLVRVFVDTDRRPPEIGTAYRTSKIEKYWRKEQ